jgi:hypothetical protein
MQEIIMIALPGWDSLERVSRWVTVFEIVMISCVAGLVIAEIFHFAYSHRKDTLTATAQQQKDDAAEMRRKTEVEGLQTQLTESDKKVSAASQTINELRKQRRLSPEAMGALIEAVKPFRGQKVRIESIMGDPEGRIYVRDFVAVFDSGGWDHDGPNGIFQTTYLENPVGVVFVISNAYASSQNMPLAARSLIQTAFNVGVIDRLAISTEPNIPIDMVVVRIGTKIIPPTSTP